MSLSLGRGGGGGGGGGGEIRGEGVTLLLPLQTQIHRRHPLHRSLSFFLIYVFFTTLDDPDVHHLFRQHFFEFPKDGCGFRKSAAFGTQAFFFDNHCYLELQQLMGSSLDFHHKESRTDIADLSYRKRKCFESSRTRLRSLTSSSNYQVYALCS